MTTPNHFGEMKDVRCPHCNSFDLHYERSRSGDVADISTSPTKSERRISCNTCKARFVAVWEIARYHSLDISEAKDV